MHPLAHSFLPSWSVCVQNIMSGGPAAGGDGEFTADSVIPRDETEMQLTQRMASLDAGTVRMGQVSVVRLAINKETEPDSVDPFYSLSPARRAQSGVAFRRAGEHMERLVRGGYY